MRDHDKDELLRLVLEHAERTHGYEDLAGTDILPSVKHLWV